MKRLLILSTGIMLLFIVIAMFWQHNRYDEFRHNDAMDRQTAFYSGDAFHVLWLIELAPDQPLRPTLLESVENAQRP